jgi:hypothetical protein
MTSRGELLETEERLQSELRSLETRLSEIGQTLSELGSMISSPRTALALHFANTDFRRPTMALGQAERTFDFPRLQRECSYDGLRDTVQQYQHKHAELHNLEYQLGRRGEELELHRLGVL